MNTADLPVIELTGGPRQRGRIHGETAKVLIAQVVEAWRADLDNFGKSNLVKQPNDADSYLDQFFSQTDYLSAITHWTPDLLEEVKGIAEGSGQTFERILGLQFMDEEWIFGLRHRLDKPTSKCTAFGLPNQENGISFAGQNMDTPSWVDGKQVLLRVMPTDTSPELLVFTFAGSIGVNGLNANGLGVTCNTLAQLNYSTDGLPVAFILRSLLIQKSVDDAERFLRSVKHASGQNYILSSFNDIRCFECCSTSVTRYKPDEMKGRVFHTNHPLINQDNSDLWELVVKRGSNSKARFDSICRRLGDTSRLMRLEDIKTALSAHDDQDNPVSRNINTERSSIGYTAGASIYELGDLPRLHLAAGPPCETEFAIFDFKDITQ